MTTNTLYRVITNTDSYSGNFERESIAYATGLSDDVSECVCEDEISMALEETSETYRQWWQQHAILQRDDDDTLCYAHLWPTQGFFNNGFGQEYEDTPENEQIALTSFITSKVRLKQKELEHLIAMKTLPKDWDQKIKDDAVAYLEQEILKTQQMTSVPKYPSYQSVCIHTDAIPPVDILEKFKDRMVEFLEGQGVKLTSFEFEEEEVQMKVKKTRGMI